MRLSFGIYFLIIGVSLIPEISSYLCDPVLDCKAEGVGTLIPDPEDCHNYYVCVSQGGVPSPTDAPLTCPSGQYFDQVTGSCATEVTPCTNMCIKSCNLNCQYELEFVAFPGNCSKYYLCLPGQEKLVGDCPASNPYFNGTDCSNDIFQCCDSCVPYCTEAFVQIADLYDCNRFYICLTTGVPPESTHQTCPTGEYFEPSLASCTAGSSCTALCMEATNATAFN